MARESESEPLPVTVDELIARSGGPATGAFPRSGSPSVRAKTDAPAATASGMPSYSAPGTGSIPVPKAAKATAIGASGMPAYVPAPAATVARNPESSNVVTGIIPIVIVDDEHELEPVEVRTVVNRDDMLGEDLPVAPVDAVTTATGSFAEIIDVPAPVVAPAVETAPEAVVVTADESEPTTAENPVLPAAAVDVPAAAAFAAVAPTAVAPTTDAPVVETPVVVPTAPAAAAEPTRAEKRAARKAEKEAAKAAAAAAKASSKSESKAASKAAEAVASASEPEAEKKPSAVLAWLALIGEVVLGLAIGAGLFWGFTILWSKYVYFALVLAVLVIFAIVTFAYVLRKRDLPTTLLALAVGLIVTIGPLVMLV
jgi:hypothetical protein